MASAASRFEVRRPVFEPRPFEAARYSVRKPNALTHAHREVDEANG